LTPISALTKLVPKFLCPPSLQTIMEISVRQFNIFYELKI
jgi:hypothetical protein